MNAVEEALRIKEAQGGEVVVVSFGPTKALDSLRKALAMGADRAMLVSDEAAAGSDLVATSYALAKGLERESADLVLFGQQSSDSDGAVLWAAVADRLQRPVISQVADLTGRRIDRDREAADAVRLRRHLGPAAPQSSPSRTPSTSRATRLSRASWVPSRSRPRRFSGSRTSESTPARVGAAGSQTSVLALGPPPAKGNQVKIEDDGSAAEQLVAWLAERKLL